MNKDKILKAAGKKGKTKIELATKLDIGYSTCSVLVNELVKEKKLVVTGQVKTGTVGRPATKYGVAA
jgi:response regulator of citrate/malate metabolism